MHRYSILLLLLVSLLFAHSQEGNFDSSKEKYVTSLKQNIVLAAGDTDKVKSLIKLAWTYAWLNPIHL